MSNTNRIITALLFAVALVVGVGANACEGRFPAKEWREFRIAQNRRERAFVALAISKADLIVVARVEDGGMDPYSDQAPELIHGRISIERTLKGKASRNLVVEWKNREKHQAHDDNVITISCWPSDDFDVVDFWKSEGYRYLVYIRNGVVLRASLFPMGPEFLSAEEEEKLASAASRK